MLTGDENIADVKFVVIWQIDPVRPEDYAFNISNQPETVKAVAESAMREVIGRGQIQRILTADRPKIEADVQELMQKVLNGYKAGILVLQVQLQSVDPPEQVIAAFKDVTAAQQDKDRLQNEADAYANRVVPEAKGKAAAIVQEAEGYKLQTVAEATGQVSRFNQIYEQYKKAPEVTRERLYLETMERVLAGDGQDHSRSERRARPGGGSLSAAWALDAAGGPRRPQVKGAAAFGAIAALIVLLVVALASLFTVDQTEQALVLRFGEPVAGRGLITTPGLHFKYPFIENVVFLDNRILVVEAPKQEVLASDNNRLDVDSFLRYRIIDPLKFYQTVGSPERANSQLGYILNSAVRRVLSEANMTQIVRDNRADLMVKIREQVNQEGGRLGIAAVDVRIRRADLPRQISEKVFSRMQSERAREAAQYRAQGSQLAQTITANADREVVVTLGNARREADQTRGAGDAERNRIFAEAFGKDPDFFAFYRSMQAYEAGLKGGDTRMVVSPKSDFFRFFGTPNGQPAAPSPVAPAAGR